MLLYNELLRLRNKLRDESRAKEIPVIATDDELFQIAKADINRKEDILKICELEPKYLNQFYDLIIKVKASLPRLTKMNDNVKKTLLELEKKLIDINKRNRMLYSPKLSSTSFDLAGLNIDPLDLLFRGKSFKINNNTEYYKYFNNVYRDAQKNIRDHGINDLYVGYYYIKGKMGDDFYIHAPLVLFPVSIEKGVNYLYIKLDKNRDITYNSHILLANYKLNDVNKPLPNCIVDNLDLGSFLNNIIDFYRSEGIEFYAIHNDFKRFAELRKDELKYVRNGDYSLERYAVLGRFSSYSTILQHDFRDIIESGYSTPNLDVLFDSKTFSQDDKISYDSMDVEYIGDLNSSQENIIKAINRKDSVVIEGPPGTGKSQTITSLITNFMFNNKTVLLVSEKKAALDVVYSRLGNLNKYVLQIDDINDKESFYNQLGTMLSDEDPVTPLDSNKLTEINNNLKNEYNRLKEIETAFYSKSNYNTPLYKLYANSKKYDESKPQDMNLLNLLNETYTLLDINIDYKELVNTYNKYNDRDLISKLLLFKEYENTYLISLRTNLSDVEVVDLRQELRSLEESLKEYNELNKMKKVFVKGNIKKQIFDLMSIYYTNGIDKSKVDYYFDNELVVDYTSYYQDFMIAYGIFKGLSNFEKTYLDLLVKGINSINHDPLHANEILYNYILYKIIIDFENKNNATINDIYNYEEIISRIDVLIKEKKRIVEKQIEYNLKSSINKIKESNNYAELNHNVTGSKRKYALNRFINRYSTELDNVLVFLMTPEVVSELFPLYTKVFDIVIFDEASQLYIERSIPTIFRAKKLVIAGDSKQLRPSSLGSGRLEYDFDEYDEDNIALEEESLLDLARFKILPSMVLNFHYRSRYEELIAFSNYAFYEDNLYIAPNTNLNMNKPIEVFKVNNAVWHNRTNSYEALMIVNLLKAFFKNRKNNETIGIITFNSSQRDLIEDTIENEAMHDSDFALAIKEEYNRKENGQDIGLFVKNIENVQGDERDVIMFSIGYAKNEYGKLVHNFGWLNQKGGENRLNVAITRAKQKVIVVTSITPNELNIQNSLNNGPKLLKKYLEYCYLVSNNDKKNAKQTLYSIHEEFTYTNKLDDIIKDLYSELSKRGFTIDYNVGIGKYMVDIAVKQNNNYILGIEFDTKLYTSNEELIERDYYRRKYMEARGWNVYRLYTMCWWKDRNLEIKRILDKLYLICMNKEYEIEE